MNAHEMKKAIYESTLVIMENIDRSLDQKLSIPQIGDVKYMWSEETGYLDLILNDDINESIWFRYEYKVGRWEKRTLLEKLIACNFYLNDEGHFVKRKQRLEASLYTGQSNATDSDGLKRYRHLFS